MLKTHKLLHAIILASLLIPINFTTLFANEKATKENTLTIATMGEPASLDIHYANGGDWEHTIYQDVYTGLFEKDAKGNAVPSLVESYTTSKDGKTYTFKLKRTNWSDGTPLTAHDFEFSFKRILAPETASEYAFFLFIIKDAQNYNAGKTTADKVAIKALDNYTLQVVLNYPASYFIPSLTHYAYFPVPKHKVEKLGKAWSKPDVIVNNGAFKITEWKANSYVKATRNKQFWDDKNTKIEHITYYTQEDRGAVLKRFRAGEVDIAMAFGSDQYEWLKANLPNEIKKAPYNNVSYIAVNVNGANKALANPNVRKALAIAVDREFLVNNVLKTGESPSYSFVPTGLEKYQPVEYDWKKLNKEERKALVKELLQSSGFNENNPLKVELSSTISEGSKKISVALTSLFKEYNIIVTPNVREVAIHYAELQKHNFELGLAGWVGDYEEASTFLDLFISTTGQNYGNYKNAKYDDLVAKAKASLNEKERNKLYNQAEAMILNDNAVIPTFNNTTSILVNQRVLGWENNTGNHHQARFFSFKQ
jgi:oligopeptide transport system substrate-binding protein